LLLNSRGMGNVSSLSGSEAPVLDMHVISELRDTGGPRGAALLQRILEIFINRSPVAIGQLDELSASGDARALADAAHALKSMCASIGARRALAACHDLEHVARAGSPFDPAVLTARISSEIDAARRAAEALRAA
jgi:HPt (histidine-containing phosphotransfer) domain-containing protein